MWVWCPGCGLLLAYSADQLASWTIGLHLFRSSKVSSLNPFPYFFSLTSLALLALCVTWTEELVLFPVGSLELSSLLTAHLFLVFRGERSFCYTLQLQRLLCHFEFATESSHVISSWLSLYFSFLEFPLGFLSKIQLIFSVLPFLWRVFSNNFNICFILSLVIITYLSHLSWKFHDQIISQKLEYFVIKYLFLI